MYIFLGLVGDMLAGPIFFREIYRLYYDNIKHN